MDRVPEPGPWIVYDDDHFYMASSMAETLGQAGHHVTYATPLPTVATWTDLTLEQSRIIDRLAGFGVTLLPNVVWSADGCFRSTLTGAPQDLGQGRILMVGARRSNDSLFEALQDQPGLGALHLAGDALVPGTIQAAVLSGHRIARKILGDAGADGPGKRVQVDANWQSMA